MKVNQEVAKKYPQLYESVIKHDEQDAKSPMWQGQITDELSIIDAKPNKLIWEFNPKVKHCNSLNIVHGGCIATVIDVCSSFAILCHTGQVKWSRLGVSTDLSVTYIRGISAGQTARVECDVLRVGKTFANMDTKVYDQDGKLCYSGVHTKYRIDDHSRL